MNRDDEELESLKWRDLKLYNEVDENENPSALERAQVRAVRSEEYTVNDRESTSKKTCSTKLRFLSTLYSLFDHMRRRLDQFLLLPFSKQQAFV